MKKLFEVAAMCAALCLASCEHIELTASDNGQQTTDETTKRFTFTVKGDFCNPEFSEATRANTYMTADNNEMTDMWVVDVVGGKIKQMLHQTPADEDWGAPKMSLTLGTHHVMFLASRGQGGEYADGVVTWTKPLDTFYKDYEVTVVKTSNGNRAVTLDRVATKMELHVEDAIPVGTTSLTLTPSVWYSGWNMMTGEPVVAPDGYCVPFVVTDAYAGVSGVYYSIWSLSSADEWTSDISIVSKAGATTNASAIIEGAPFKANRATVYRGSLYSNASESSVSLNATWLQDYEGVY